ncbi:MAG: DUF892 family protein [Ginsengibacter sp.]
MEKLIDLRDLLKHEILDLHSAEEQIIEALPAMIEKANNESLKAALKEHLKITEIQKKRLEDIQQKMLESETNEGREQGEQEAGGEGNGESKKQGFFTRLFGGGGQKCLGMEGLITEGNKMMGEDMSPEVLDAAIIASAQKIEHYEICGYGTARAFARELQLSDIANILTETLNEEYTADDMLTQLAVSKLNVDAEFAEDNDYGKKARALRTSTPVKKTSGSNNSQRSAAPKRAPAKKQAGQSSSRLQALKSRGGSSFNKSSAAKKTPAKKSVQPAKKSNNRNTAPSKTLAKKAVKKVAPKKVAAKKTPPKKAPAKNAAKKTGRTSVKATSKKVAVKKTNQGRRR